MTSIFRLDSRSTALALASIVFCVSAPIFQAKAQGFSPLPSATKVEERVVGPYDVNVLAGGPGLTKHLLASSKVLEANSPYTLTMWVELSADPSSFTLIAGIGDAAQQDSRYVGLTNGKPMLRLGRGNLLVAPAAIVRSGWHFLAVSFDGSRAHLYVDGAEVAQGAMAQGRAAPELTVAPVLETPAEQSVEPEPFEHFGGHVLHVTLYPNVLLEDTLRTMARERPGPTLSRYEDASLPWPVQIRGQAGYTEPQDPSLMPQSKEPFSKPMAKPLPPMATSALTPAEGGYFILNANWMMAAAPDVKETGQLISAAGFDSRRWLRATIPGTVLTTLVDRGVYPDPDYGLNNLAIPESLARQDYWYRVEFKTPINAAGRHTTITFKGINYAAEVWFNGHKLGKIKGAFIRGSFNVAPYLRSDGMNALAVRISPPPHPGIPEEESILAGPGENGGAMALDGPTFVATEGWDWIPGIRDRNTGIWQDVVLTVTNQLQLGDPQVISRLPLPDTSSADVEISVPVQNESMQPIDATLHASFERVDIEKKVTIAPGQTSIRLTRDDFPQLHVEHPRLWWPNGYGRPDLYHLKLAISAGDRESDRKELTFGIREVTYELSLFDSTGHLRRVEASPTEAKALNQQIVDVSHEGMRNRQAEFYAASLTKGGEHSAAVKPVTNEPGLTDLVIKVNGVRIAARGGNWGMDDSRKRVSREHLEPFFRLHKEANLNIIRNWVGQDTEETFFELADEYGLMVWNDFWASTQNYNVEPQDVPLFLDNAHDVVRRFRNHPSIILWCGRNEGVPQPVLNEGLIDLFQKEDGTRYYTPGSNRINLRNSGPYKYQSPDLFYSTLDKGFSVELGIASLSTLESLKASIAPADQWPISDAWAYHDWHQTGNGEVAPLMRKIEQYFGAATDLEDFERKAQMFNYVDHRAIFEGFNQHLWLPNSGRMLWMTQPAWPSNMWQILSSDYDTQASFYGVKKACEPLHVQLDLSDYTVAAVNTTNANGGPVMVHAMVYSLANQVLLARDQQLNLNPNATAPLFVLPLAPLFESEGVVLVRLEMRDAKGTLISSNTYWLAGDEDRYRKLNTLSPAKLTASATSHRDGDEIVVDLQLTNGGTVAAIATKATLLDAKSKERILPAYFTDNYVTLLPGESMHLSVRYPATANNKSGAKVSLRGWNLPNATIDIVSHS